jgi:hypothetical protein
MRRVLALVIACSVLQVVNTQEQSLPEQPLVTANDRLARTLWRLAVATNTKIGFEATDHVRIYGSSQSMPPLSVSNVDDGLNALVAADDRYAWRTVNGVYLVRPKRAWDDPSDPFNRPMRNVQVANESSYSVLIGLRDFIYTNTFAIDPSHRGAPAAILVSFTMPSGTVIDALDELMKAADQVMWIGAYRPNGQPAERFPKWDLSLELRGVNGTSTLSGSYPPRRK